MLRRLLTVVLIVVVIAIVPFAHNLWDGRLRRSMDTEILTIRCEDMEESLSPHTDAMVRTMRDHGPKLDPSSNFNTAQGCKAARAVYASHASEICEAVDAVLDTIADRASQAAGVTLSPAPCDQETYCWFTRVYEHEGDSLSWHFDNNFSSARRYTYVQELDVSDGNTSHFMTQDGSQNIRVYVSKTGNALLYDGSSTKHAISQQAEGGRRVVLIVPLYENYAHGMYGSTRRWARQLVYKKMALRAVTA